MKKSLYQICGAILVTAGVAFCVLAVLARTDGLLVYALDDPYIHLAVAENLAAGHGYGINPGEAASPSSSILYPFLLVPLVAMGLGHLAPFALAFVGALGCAWLMGDLVWRAYNDAGPAQYVPEPLIVLPLALLCANVIGLTLTGMEHTLHVWASLAILLGVIALRSEHPAPRALVLGIIFAPLLRFEGMALSLAALVMLAFTGRLRLSLSLAGVIVAAFLAYLAYMSSLGLPWLPSSVMTKHAASAAMLGEGQGNPVMLLASNVTAALAEARPPLLLFGIALFIIALIRENPARSETDRRVIWCVGFATVAHLLVGQYGWWSRYEVYIVAVLVGALLFVYRDIFSASLASTRARFGATVLSLLAVCGAYLNTTLLTPAASENVYAQQYQMHRFSTEFYPSRFAANDIGYLAYDNPAYILDLWGLGSEEARKAAADGQRTPDEVRALSEAKQIDYAMLYNIWFPLGVPGEWCHIANLRSPVVSTAAPVVSFYLANREEEAAFREALDAFKATLPQVTELFINPVCKPV